jgi:DNA (cytosine-5)-methyltransferase 1
VGGRRPVVSRLRVVSLFAGIEGIGLAFDRAGAETALAVELDAAARGVIADRMPRTRLMADVTETRGDDVRAAGLDPDRTVLTAGWPCQGNSVAGNRGGMDDPRSGLWLHVRRLLAEVRPRWFVGENVPGLLSVSGGQDFARVLDDLADLGYGWAYRVLDAQFFGVPQRRRRVFVVGRLGDRAGPVEVLLEPEGGARHPAPRGEAGQSVAGTLGGRAGGSRTTDLDGHGAYVVARPLVSHGGNDKHDPSVMTYVPYDLRSGTEGEDVAGTLQGHQHGYSVNAMPHVIGFDAAQITHPENRVNPQPGDPAAPLAATGLPMVATLTANPGDGGRRQEDDVNLAVYLIGQDALRGEGVARTPSPDAEGRVRLRDPGFSVGEKGDPAATIAASGPGAVVSLAIGQDVSTGEDVAQTVRAANGQPGDVAYALRRDPGGTGQGHNTTYADEGTAVRRLTPTECERLQGFPDGWTATSGGRPQSDSARYRQLGNAVAVPVVEWIARRIVEVDAR